jgi:hypothetical protein
MIGGVVRFALVTKATFVLFTIFLDVPRVVAFMANNARGFGREVWGWDCKGNYRVGSGSEPTI